MFKRRLGRSNLEVSAMGLGCWAIGGAWTFEGEPAGWGQVDDAESVRAIHYALDARVTSPTTASRKNSCDSNPGPPPTKGKEYGMHR